MVGKGSSPKISKNLVVQISSQSLRSRPVSNAGRLVRPPTERYTFEDASTIEAECPEVLYVLPNYEDFEILVTNRNGNQTRVLLEAATANYALGMGWGVTRRQISHRKRYRNRSTSLCLGGRRRYGTVRRSVSTRGKR